MYWQELLVPAPNIHTSQCTGFLEYMFYTTEHNFSPLLHEVVVIKLKHKKQVCPCWVPTSTTLNNFLFFYFCKKQNVFHLALCSAACPFCSVYSLSKAQGRAGKVQLKKKKTTTTTTTTYWKGHIIGSQQSLLTYCYGKHCNGNRKGYTI